MSALISYINLADAATVSNAASGGVEVLPETNTQVRQIGKPYRETITAPASVILDYDLGSAQNIKLVSVIGHNVSDGTYAIALGTTSGASDVASDSGTLWQGADEDQKQQHVIFSQVYSARYVRVTVTPTSSQDVDIGRVWIDNPWAPDVSVDFEHEVMDESDNERSIGLSAYSYERPRVRMNRIRFPRLSEQQAIGDSSDNTVKCAHHMDATIGTHSPMVCIPVSTGQADNTQAIHKFGIYGSIRRSTPIKPYPAKDEQGGWLYSKSFDVVEER